MKKLFLLCLILWLSSFSLQGKKLFIEMEFYKNCIKLDDGSNKKPQPIKGEDGKDLKFKSIIGALNYMSMQGWELVDTKSVVSGMYLGGHGGTETKVYYLFSKDVPDAELKQIVDNCYKKD